MALPGILTKSKRKKKMKFVNWFASCSCSTFFEAVNFLHTSTRVFWSKAHLIPKQDFLEIKWSHASNTRMLGMRKIQCFQKKAEQEEEAFSECVCFRSERNLPYTDLDTEIAQNLNVIHCSSLQPKFQKNASPTIAIWKLTFRHCQIYKLWTELWLQLD